nr:hypothetical protein GCM10025732_21080 [Glycomyces mayteni]
MTDLLSASGDAANADVEVLVVGVFSGEDAPVLPESLSGVDAEFDGRLAAQLAALGNTGAAGSLTRLPAPEGLHAGLVYAVGLGDADDLDDETLRRAAGTAVRAAFGKATVAIAFEGDPEATATGAVLGAYKYEGFKTDGGGDAAPESIAVYGASEAAAARARVLGESVALVKDWVSSPRTCCARRRSPSRSSRPPSRRAWRSRSSTPRRSRRAATAACSPSAAGRPRSRAWCGCRTGPRARASTSRSSARASRSTPAATRSPAAGMWEMKYDMAGAAAVVGATVAAAKLGLNVNVTCTVALAENLVSGSAYRPPTCSPSATA